MNSNTANRFNMPAAWTLRPARTALHLRSALQAPQPLRQHLRPVSDALQSQLGARAPMDLPELMGLMQLMRMFARGQVADTGAAVQPAAGDVAPGVAADIEAQAYLRRHAAPMGATAATLQAASRPSAPRGMPTRNTPGRTHTPGQGPSGPSRPPGQTLPGGPRPPGPAPLPGGLVRFPRIPFRGSAVGSMAVTAGACL